MAHKVRRGAALCREQLTESSKMLRQVEQTASSVLSMFPDLELAIEEGEPQLAMNFFSTVKNWVVELRELVSATQKKNKLSMDQVGCFLIVFCMFKRVISVYYFIFFLLLREHNMKEFLYFLIVILDSANSGRVYGGTDCEEEEPAEDCAGAATDPQLDLESHRGGGAALPHFDRKRQQ